MTGHSTILYIKSSHSMCFKLFHHNLLLQASLRFTVISASQGLRSVHKTKRNSKLGLDGLDYTRSSYYSALIFKGFVASRKKWHGFEIINCCVPYTKLESVRNKQNPVKINNRTKFPILHNRGWIQFDDYLVFIKRQILRNALSLPATTR